MVNVQEKCNKWSIEYKFGFEMLNVIENQM